MIRHLIGQRASGKDGARGHVAAHTLLRGVDGARFLGGTVTAQTGFLVGPRSRAYIIVRVVARDTGQLIFALNETLAQGQAKGLEALRTRLLPRVHGRQIGSGAMTAPTKLVHRLATTSIKLSQP